MNSIQIFNNAEFGNIRTVVIDNEPWFVGKDIAMVLGYSEPRSAVSKKVDEEDRGVAKMETPSGIQEMTIINESGLYSLILSSKLPSAKKFKRWVTSEVLPAIRKKGFYDTQTEKSTGFTAGMTELDVEVIVEKVIEKLSRKTQRDIFIENKSVYEECNKNLYHDIDAYLIEMRKQELYKNVEVIAKYYDFDCSYVLHIAYKELERKLGIALNAYKSVYKSETGKNNVCMVEVIVANDRIYKEAMGLTRYIIEKMEEFE